MDDRHKYQKLEKFAQGIGTCGLKTKSIVLEGNLDAKGYINKCLLPEIIPFIEKHDRPVICVRFINDQYLTRIGTTSGPTTCVFSRYNEEIQLREFFLNREIRKSSTTQYCVEPFLRNCEEICDCSFDR